MNLSLEKKTIILIIATVVLITTGYVLYLGIAVNRLQDESTAARAKELASVVARDIDIDMLVNYREMVDEIYDSAESRVSNDEMGTPEYEEYCRQFLFLESTSEYAELYEKLRSLQDTTDVDCFYLCYLDKGSKCVVYLVDSGDNNICHPGTFDHLKGNDLKALNDPNMTLAPSVSNTEIYGDVIGSAVPVVDNGEVVAYVGVDISMSQINSRRNRLLKNTILSVILLAIILSAVSLFLSGQFLMKPMSRHEELVEESEQLKKNNINLARRAQAAQRISSLTGSVTSLLNNMPALTFSKDVENGVYLACNQMFAEYADKKTPAEVVGHTDAELFDMVTAKHFADDDKKALSMDEPYIFREDVPDARGNMRSFQTTKLKFTDTSGRLCLLGMGMDVSELVMMRKENIETKEALDQMANEKITYSRIAMALSSDYTFIYYVDVKNESYIEYTAGNEVLNIETEMTGKDFFNLSRDRSNVVIYSEDREVFQKSFTKENVINTIDREGRYVITYRLLVGENPVYVNLKAVRMKDDEDHIIIGVNNIDDMMKLKELAERMKQEKATYDRVMALSGHYICIYNVNPVTDDYVEYSATGSYKSIALPREGGDFFTRTFKESKKIVYEEDKKLFFDTVTKKNILNEIKKNGIFSLKYRLMINGEPRYVLLSAAMMQEKDGPQLVVGVSDIDERERLDQQYARNLRSAEVRANIDSLTGVKNKHAYVDLESQINERIRSGEEDSFAVVICDVNGLKKVNDTRGHKAGDMVIKKACSVICEIFGDGEVFRIGGDEFAVVLEGSDLNGLSACMEDMQRRNLMSRRADDVVIACGMSKYTPGDSDFEQVFERADAAMYENKEELKRKSSGSKES